jgi:hypothetical protein
MRNNRELAVSTSESPAFQSSRTGFLARPIVRFLGGVAAPPKERIVERHRRLKLRKVVLVHARIAERCCQETRTLRGEVGPRGVGTSYDLGQVKEGSRPQSELLDHRVECAGLAAMTPEYAFDVERRGIEAFCDAHHFRRDDEEEDRLRVDEPPDQPGAGDAIDLWPVTRNPEGPALLIARRELVGADQRLAGLLPGFKPTIEHLGTYAFVPQPSGRALAELLSLMADDDSRSSLILPRPVGDGTKVPTQRSRQQARVRPVVLIRPHVDNRRRPRKTYEP